MARTLVNSVDITPATTAQIGDVIHSMLTEAEFQAIRGTDWVLADGRDATGTGYGVIKTGDAVTPVSLPDMRGQFLRGLDTSGVVDPDGAGRVVGNSQADDFGSHNHGGGNHQHNLEIWNWPPSGANVPSYGWNTAASSGNTRVKALNSGTIISTQGGAETRPKNVAVNIFIKIN